MDRLAYAAHTRSAIFYLDEAGICQELVAADPAVEIAPELSRCIGAQYVASLDLSESAGLVALPRAGASLLFVVADAHMTFSLVRTAPIERFETLVSVDEVEDDVLLLDDDSADDDRATTPAPASPTPDVQVAWPKGEALTRALPLPPAAFNLMAPPQPVRRVSP